MGASLTEEDALKLEYLKRTTGLGEEARGRYTRQFTELMQKTDPVNALREFVSTLPKLQS